MLKLQKLSKYRKFQTDRRTTFLKQQLYVDQNQQYQQQFQPEFIHNHFRQQSGLSYFQNLYESKYFSRQFQDSILTLFIYKKITLIRYTMMSFASISIFMSIFSSGLSNIATYILIVQSILTLGLIMLTILKQSLLNQLKKLQLLRQKYQNKYLKFISSIFVQTLILLMHPNLLTHNLSLTISQPIQGSSTPLQINTFLQILMQSRIYLLFLAVINSSIYCNTRAHRLCRIYSTKSSLFFGVKSLFQYKPLTFLVVLYISLIVTYGQMISLSERQLKPAFSHFQNSVWLIIITMGTVGYGDYSPITYLGRCICFSASISGIIISSLLILTLSRYLSMSNGQNKSHITLKRLQLRRLLQNYSKQTITFTTKMMFQPKSRSDQQNSQQNKRIMQQLKKKTQRVKFAIRRIKNMVDTDNLKQQINRLFQALSESLNQIYKYQQEYSKLLIQLYKKEKETINQIQFSFTTQIQNIIKDR